MTKQIRIANTIINISTVFSLLDLGSNIVTLVLNIDNYFIKCVQTVFVVLSCIAFSLSHIMKDAVQSEILELFVFTHLRKKAIVILQKVEKNLTLKQEFFDLLSVRVNVVSILHITSASFFIFNALCMCIIYGNYSQRNLNIFSVILSVINPFFSTVIAYIGMRQSDINAFYKRISSESEKV